MIQNVTFIDIEVSPGEDRIQDIGCVKDDQAIFHSNNITELLGFLEGTEYLCGHNIIHHDLKYLKKYYPGPEFEKYRPIDTLYLSPLLFPRKEYHHLVKDDKLISEELNNPVNDSKKARELFNDELTEFKKLPDALQKILYALLHGDIHFKYFFYFLDYEPSYTIREINPLIKQILNDKICFNVDLNSVINGNPVELAYCVAFLDKANRESIIPPWVLKTYPEVERILFLLRANPCIPGCSYCDQRLDPHFNLKKIFGFQTFKTYNGRTLQEDAVRAAIQNKSILTIFPTGGGKSLTFQLPALMAGENYRGLTVVISPLQSLMKDQVNNLEEYQITDAVTINGLLDPIERQEAINRVEDGRASILYISPESLRSKTIERILANRNIARFVIDEAHCFSSWGHDFRVDYLYIGDFIKHLQELKNTEIPIPVSCFTATARQNVIEDICKYFEEKLDQKLEIFKTDSSRKNLKYRILPAQEDEKKYQTLRNLLEQKDCPTIIYVARTRKAFEIAQRLSQDHFSAAPYHGQMDPAEKTKNQDAFKNNEIQIMVATSAFGMGVDKSDVGMVIHYDISDSLENYVQEAGRAGRDEKITAECYVLYNEDDINKHFLLHNQSKLDIKEIRQIWRALKELNIRKNEVSNSALEIARKAGWDENIKELETRVTAAISALEQSGYVKRIHNSPRIFATSILARNADEAIGKIISSGKFNEKEESKATRIIKMLISNRSRKHSNEEVAESRVDYISDLLGIDRQEVLRLIYKMREIGVLADEKDLTAYIKKEGTVNKSINILKSFAAIEKSLLDELKDGRCELNIKEVNEKIQSAGIDHINTNKIKVILNFWSIKNWIKKGFKDHSRNHVAVVFKKSREDLSALFQKRHELSEFIIQYLFGKLSKDQLNNLSSDKILLEFSELELKRQYELQNKLFNLEITAQEIEDALFFLSRIEALQIDGGFLVIYNRLNIRRLEENRKVQYKIEDFKTLQNYYRSKIQQIHIVNEYAKKMIDNYESALKFVDDYFQLNYTVFLRKYFPGEREGELVKPLSPAKFNKLIGDLTTSQNEIIRDSQSKTIVVAAGPGSGKTKVLVHKLASLLLMEDIKSEQLLMLTFSRAAATGFKLRLKELIGNAAYYIDIKTFHSYCFDLLGRVGNLEKSEDVIKETVEKIRTGEVERSKITKTVLVIDEAQDMSYDQFELVKSLMEKNEEMRVIAVGDDDQNIYSFRGADSSFMISLITAFEGKKYELLDNFRSTRELVEFTNQYVRLIPNRLKKMPIRSANKETGRIKYVSHDSEELIVPIVEDLASFDLSGTTGILTETNDDAYKILGLLNEKNINGRLVQSNDRFRLIHMEELRFIIDYIGKQQDVHKISAELWAEAKKELSQVFKDSANLETVLNILKMFEKEYSKSMYFSDLKHYIWESELSDFHKKENDTINVSTIHKSKGKEFDSVFIMIRDFVADTDERKRQLYVGMTRAKKNLVIHTHQNFIALDPQSNIEYKHDTRIYPPPKSILVQLSHHDVYLGYFKYVQHRIQKLHSGEILNVDPDGCFVGENEYVLKFSKAFQDKLESLGEKGYHSKKAVIRYKLYYKLKNNDEDKEEELLIVLPELQMVIGD